MLVLLGALIAVGPLSIDMYLPAFPAVERGLGVPHGSAEFTLAAFFIGLALGQAVYGPLSDRFGRRKPLLAGLALYAFASAGCAFAGSLPALVAWRFLQALGGCAGMVITRAVVRDRCGAREAARAFSMLLLVMGLAPILAPLLGSWVATTLGWRAIFFVLVAFGLTGFFTILTQLEESHDTRHEPPLRLGKVLRDYAGLLANRAFLGFVLVGGMSMAGMFAYIAGSPFVLMELYGVPAKYYGWVFGANALGFIAASQINVRLLKRHPPTELLRRSLWVPALTAPLLALLALAGWLPQPLLLAGFFTYIASLGFLNPNSTAAALATHGQQAGTASALLGTVQFALATVSGALVGTIHDGTARPVVFIMAACGIGAWAAYRGLIVPLEKRTHFLHPGG